jgi:general secretion pathway protein C
VRWLPWGVALLVWLLAGFSVAYWALRWIGSSPATPVPVAVSAPLPVDPLAVAKALGAQAVVAAAAPVAAPTRYVLTGVVAPAGQAGGSGVALIAIEGQRPSPYRVGAVLDGRWRVQAVERRAVVLQPESGDAGATTTLSLPTAALVGQP